jgi:hypothetical protein
MTITRQENPMPEDFSTHQIVDYLRAPDEDEVTVRISHFPEDGVPLADREYLQFTLPDNAAGDEFLRQLANSLLSKVGYYNGDQESGPAPEAVAVS